MKKILLVGVLGILCSGCIQAEMLSPLTLDETRPTGIARDFVAVYESREGNLVSTTEIVQSGTGIVLHKKNAVSESICSNLKDTLICQSGSGTLLDAEDASQILRVEALTTQRLLGRQRILGDEVKAMAKQIPANLNLFSQNGFTAALASVAGEQPQAMLNSCYEKTTTEEKEFFCFGGDLMPYWADTTFTEIGNITLMRILKAYSPVTLTQQQMQALWNTWTK